LGDLSQYTHFLFTSKNAVRVFFELSLDVTSLYAKIWIAIGASTAHALATHFRPPDWTAETETQEGLIALLEQKNLDNAHFFLPRSSLSRPALSQYLHKRNIRYTACDVYDTVTQRKEPLPDLTAIDEIVFTSPSTVRAFLEIFGHIPKDKQLHAIGLITKQFLMDMCCKYPR
jgi:uroporphyrinogen-III synthase